MMPSHIGQFEIKNILGSGGFGTVYAAIDTDLRRWVAIKTLRPEISGNPAMMERFRSEGISLGRLNHTNITTLYGMPRVGQDVFLVMELVNGQTLDTVLGRLRRLGVQETLAIIAQTAAGLGYAHRMGVIHRDIKPSNLMLTETGVLKIMDFGIARIRGTERLTRTGLLGTYAYLAPEQFRGGEGSERSDLYSLACVVYEALSGNIPFDAPTEAEIMRGHLELPVRPLRELAPDITPAVDLAVQRALAKDPAARFATVDEFSDAIGASAIDRAAPGIVRDNILARVPPPARPTTIYEPPSTGDANRAYTPATDLLQGIATRAPSRSGLSRKLPALLLGAAGMCVAAGLGLLLWQPWQTDSADQRVPAPDTAPAQTDTASVPPLTLVSPRPIDSAFISSKPKSPDASVLIKSPGLKSLHTMSVEELIDSGRPAAELVTEAARRFNTGDESEINGAMLVLQYAAKTLHSASAFLAMARIYDPNQPDRPQGLQPDLSQAAQNYRAAVMEGDTSAVPDRDALRAYLEQRASGNGPEAARASAVLERFWR